MVGVVQLSSYKILVAVTLVSVRFFAIFYTLYVYIDIYLLHILHACCVLQGGVLEYLLLQHVQVMSTVKEISDNLCAKSEIENEHSEVLGTREGLSYDGIISIVTWSR